MTKHTLLANRQHPLQSIWRFAPCALLLLSVPLAGCASSSPTSTSLFDKALEMVGLQSKPALPEVTADSLQNLPTLSKKVTLRIHAGETLNTDASGRSLSLVAKVYRLKAVEQFLQTPYDAFKDLPGGKATPIEGVVEVREVVLTPGQKYEVIETVPSEVTHLAVVALFRAPDDKRWRFVFDVKGAAATGVTIGVHGCAMSVSEGQPLNAAPESLRLAGVRCR